MSGAWRRALCLVVACAALASVPGIAYAERTIGLTTGRFDFSVAAGQSQGGSLEVINSGDEPLTVLVYAGNQAVDVHGEITYTVPSRDDPDFLYSPASWIRLDIGAETGAIGNIPYIKLEPGESAPVDFEIDVPDGVPPGDHQIIIFFEMSDRPETPEGTGTSATTGRIGCRIRVRVQGEIVERMEVRPFWVRGVVMGESVPWSYALRNGGNVDKVVDARLILLDGSGNEILASRVATETSIYAGALSENAGVLDTLRQLVGRYTMRLEVTYPREGQGAADVPELIAEERSVWIVPLWLAITAIVLAGGLLLWLSWRQAVRSAQRRVDRGQIRGKTRGGRHSRSRRRRQAAQSVAAEDPSDPDA